jgi:hypothetical protein
MLLEGGRLALSHFAKVAAQSGLLKARVESKGIAWRACRTIQFHACAREIRFSRAERFVVRTDEKLIASVELEAAIRKNSIDTLCRRLP